MAKVPQINGCVYIKILKLKDHNHNKLFHIEKLKKVELVKSNHTIQSNPKKKDD